MCRTVLAALVGCAVVLLPAPLSAQSVGPKKAGQKKEEPESRGLIAGKTFEQWLKEIRSSDPSKQENAILTVRLFGPERAREAAHDILIVLKKHSFTYPLDISVRTSATVVLGDILSNVKDPDPKQLHDALKLMKAMLSDPQDIVRYRAALALAQIGPLTKDETLKDEIAQKLRYPLLSEPRNWETRRAAAVALGRLALPPLPTKLAKGEQLKITPVQQQILIVAIKGLSERVRVDKSFQVRLASIQALMTLGQLFPLLPETTAMKSLRAEMERDLTEAATKALDKSVQVWANVTLMVVNPANREKVDEKLLAHIGKLLLNAADPLARVQAAQALGLLGEKAASQIKQLEKALDDPDKEVAVASLTALVQIGRKGLPAVGNVLADASKDADLRAKAAELLAALGSSVAFQLEALSKLPDNKVRKDRQAALISVQAALRGQLPILKEAAKDHNKKVREAAIRSLPHLDPAGIAYVGELVNGSKELPVRLLAIEALATAGEKASSQLMVLETAAKDADKNVKDAAIRALPQLGEAGVKYVGELLAVSKDKAERLTAIQALSSVGPKAKSQVGLLKRLLADDDRNVVAASVLALGRIGKDAEPALPDLQKLSNNPMTPGDLRALTLNVIDVIEGIAKLKLEEEKNSKTPANGQ
jgi:HEAT repeat protein